MRTGSEFKWSGIQAILKYFEFLMSFVYAALGIAVLWKSQELFFIPVAYSIPLGCTLIAYSIFRGYRVYQKYF